MGRGEWVNIVNQQKTVLAMITQLTGSEKVDSLNPINKVMGEKKTST